MSKARVVIVATLLCILSFALCACDLFGNGGNTSSSNGENKNNGNGKVERKITFEQASENYSAQKYKRADAELNVGATFILKIPKSTESIQATVAAASNVSRINGDLSAMSATLKKGKETSEKVNGFLSMLSEMPEKNGIISSKNDTEEGAKKQYVKYLQDFFNDKINFFAVAGIKDGTLNVKGTREYLQGNGTMQSDGAWYVVGEKFLTKLFGNEVKSFGFADKIVATELFDTSKAKDDAPKIVREDGFAAYDMTFGTEGVRNFISSLAEKAKSAVKGDVKKTEALENLKGKLLKSISEEHSSFRFTAQVGGNKLPVESEMQCKLALNINKGDVNAIVKVLRESGIIDQKTADNINGMFYILTRFSCDLDGKFDDKDGGKAGVVLSFTTKEKYYYGKENCSMQDVDEELFYSEKEDVDGRVRLEDLLEKITATKAVEIIKTTVLPLGKMGSAIAAEIEEKLDLSRGVTYDEIKTKIKEVLEKYKDNEEIGGKVELILNKLFK